MTGRPWRHAAKDGALDGLPPIVAAGGLTPENVGHVIRLLRPWAVDVSSGVEESLGIKSRRKIEAFLAAVRNADSENARCFGSSSKQH